MLKAESVERHWKADPHPWGPGKTHLIDDGGARTFCGQALGRCPGRPVPAVEYDCRACAKVQETRRRREDSERRWEERSRELQAQREKENREWWARYNAYLRSPGWRRRRDAVMGRARHMCEGCRIRPATQVHHLSYKHLGDEPLFELAAVCDRCHRRITDADRATAVWAGTTNQKGVTWNQ